MSIRSNGSGDHLAYTGTFSIGTGDFSLGVWTKVINARASQFIDFVSLVADETGSTAWCSMSTDNASTTHWKGYDNTSGAGDADLTASSPTAGSWFWCVIRRSGTTMQWRIFDDTTSTTPVRTVDSGSGGGSFAAFDWLVVSETFSGEWADAEFVNLKLHQGVAWTDAQSRTESQHTLNQTGGGTWVVRARLIDLATGLTNLGTLGGSVVNTGCVDGASNPGQLTDDAGGGDTGTEAGFRRLVAVRGAP